MAHWEPKTVKEVVEGIAQEVYVLPVIQRNLVWGKEKMELLFDTLLKGNAFGGIMVLKEDSQQVPLFAYRLFSKHGEWHDSREPERLHQDKYLVIDGQQRLQSFYMGLKGSFNNSETLYFNLNSSPEDYEFGFAESTAKLQEWAKNGAAETEPKIWYSTPALYSQLNTVQDDFLVADEVIAELEVTREEHKNRIHRNIRRFYSMVMAADTIGISSVTVNRLQVETEKVRIVELFRRLNDGGTRLSALDLMASVFKGFDYRMEKFFKTVEEFKDMQIFQDEIIKFIFILQDQPTKEVTQVTQHDAAFVLNNQERILAALQGLRKFLDYSGMLNYYKERGRSVIPLYFVAYHIFYAAIRTERLPDLYDNYDTNNPDFLRVKRWLYLSVLNGVFSRGCGWIPYVTGINKILRTLQEYKEQPFPDEALFQVYKRHPLRFSEALTSEQLSGWDRDFVFYLMYSRRPEVGRDIDHVHPKSRLETIYPPEKIHSMANYQLLDIGTNRNEKRAKPLAEWMKDHVTDTNYRNRHLIPADESLWHLKHFDRFLHERAQMIVDKVNEFVPEPLPDSSSPNAVSITAESSTSIDLKAVSQQLPSKLEQHPILKDETPLFNVFRNQLTATWSGRYRNELVRFNIHTLADFARVVMCLKLELWYDAGYARVYRFHKTLANGQKIQFNQKNFGGWGWQLILEELQKRGLTWQEFVV